MGWNFLKSLPRDSGIDSSKAEGYSDPKRLKLKMKGSEVASSSTPMGCFWHILTPTLKEVLHVNVFSLSKIKLSVMRKKIMYLMLVRHKPGDVKCPDLMLPSKNQWYIWVLTFTLSLKWQAYFVWIFNRVSAICTVLSYLLAIWPESEQKPWIWHKICCCCSL